MVEIKEGDIIDLAGKKTGNSANGVWVFVPVKSDKNDKKTISIWADNPDDAKMLNGKAKVTKITSCKYSARKGSGSYSDKWFDTVSITATLEQLSEADLYATGYADENFESQFDDSETPFV